MLQITICRHSSNAVVRLVPLLQSCIGSVQGVQSFLLYLLEYRDAVSMRSPCSTEVQLGWILRCPPACFVTLQHSIDAEQSTRLVGSTQSAASFFLDSAGARYLLATLTMDPSLRASICMSGRRLHG